MENEKAKALKYFKEHGFLFASNSEQLKAAEELVSDGVIQKAKKEWFSEHVSGDYFYVDTSVSSKETMPAALHKMIYPVPDFKVGEVVSVRLLTSLHRTVYVHGSLVRVPYETKDGKLVVVIVQDEELVLPAEDIFHTYQY